MTRADYLVVIATLIFLAWLYPYFWGNGSRGEQAVVRAVGQQATYYPLTENRRITVRGTLGNSIIDIHDGRVRFVDSPCQGKQCIHTGWLNADGQIAACLPNGVSVTVQGRDSRFDAVNF